MANNSVSIEVKLDESGVTSGVRRVKASLGEIEGADKGLSWGGVALGGTVANLASGAIGALGGTLLDVGKSVVETGGDFEASMSKVASLSGATGDEFDALERAAREYGASSVFSATQAADALGYMALAGWDTQQSIEGLPGVLDLAASSGMGLAEASDMVTDYLTAFGLEAKDSTRFADMLAYAQANSNTSAEALGEAYKNCAANLSASGQDVETVTSLLSMMANQGLKGSEAGTALAAVMRDITAQMQDGAIAIGDTSVAVTDADGNFRDLTDILTDVESATYGMGDAERAAALSATFTADSTKGLNLLLNAGMGEAAGFEEALRGSAGAAGEMAAAMTDNLQGDVENLNGALEELQLKCYDAVQPALRGIVQVAADELVPAVENVLFGAEQVVPVFDEFGTQIDTTTERSGGLVGALSGMAEAIGPGVEGALGAIQTLSEGAAPAMQTIVDAASGLRDRVGEAAGAVGESLAGAFEALTPVIEPAADFLANTAAGAFQAVCDVAGALADGVGGIAGIFTSLAEEAGPSLQAFFEGFSLEAATTTVQNLADTFTNALNPVIQTAQETLVPALGDAFAALSEALPGIQEVFDSVINAIGNIIGTVFSTASTTVSTAMTMISDVIGVALDAIDGDWSGAWEGVKQLGEDVWNGLGDLSQDIFGVDITETIETFCSNVGTVWDETWSAASDTASDLWGDITQTVSGAVDDAGSAIDTFCQNVGSWWDDTWNAVSDTASTIWDGITQTIDGGTGEGRSVVQTFCDEVSGMFDSWGIDDTVSGIFQNIQTFMEDPVGAAADAISGFLGNIQGVFNGLDFNLPRFALPHFHVDGGSFPWGIGGMGSPPTFDVQWYKTGAIATGPSVVGIGEAGNEAVVPLSGAYMRPFAKAVAEEMPRGSGDIYVTIQVDAKVEGGQDIDELADRLSRRMAEDVRREMRRAGLHA